MGLIEISQVELVMKVQQLSSDLVLETSVSTLVSSSGKCNNGVYYILKSS